MAFGIRILIQYTDPNLGTSKNIENIKNTGIKNYKKRKVYISNNSFLLQTFNPLFFIKKSAVLIKNNLLKFHAR